MDIHQLRIDYSLKRLFRKDLLLNPIDQFNVWLHEAIASKIDEPNAMCVATCDKQCRPSSRMVLLKSFDEQGFVFCTHQHSRKAQELLENPYASLTFFWYALQRQVHIEGMAVEISREEAERHFDHRPRKSQLASWTSEQDAFLPSREVLEEAYRQNEERFANQRVPTPSTWVGFRVVPSRYEFWQGRESRLHDRFVYTKGVEGWEIVRVSP